MSDAESGTVHVTDPYQKVCQAMEPGLLITVNDSTPHERGFDEMEVLSSDEHGKLRLKGHDDTYYILRHDDAHYEGPAIEEVSETEFSPAHEPVVSIEVIGIA